MVKRINGKVYDTLKGTAVDVWDNGCEPSSFMYVEEIIYKHQSRDEYFLHGDGGPMTRYGHRCEDGSLIGGEDIILLGSIEDVKGYIADRSVYGPGGGLL